MTFKNRSHTSRWHIVFVCVIVMGGQRVCMSQTTSNSAVLREAFDAIQTFRDREDPMEAIANGRPGDAFRISDHSAAAIARRDKETIGLLKALQTVPREGLSDSELLDLDLVIRDLSLDVQAQKFLGHLLVILSLIHISEPTRQP
jgi:uncharacterized protein (DUF885 family)